MLLISPKTHEYKFNNKYWFSSKFDDTDNLETGSRSGLILYVDHGTGVHYIKSPIGSLTPRLDKNGNVVTKYQQHEEK